MCFRLSILARRCASVISRFGPLPNLYGYSEHLVIGHSLISLVISQQQSRHFSRIALSGVLILPSLCILAVQFSDAPCTVFECYVYIFRMIRLCTVHFSNDTKVKRLDFMVIFILRLKLSPFENFTPLYI